MKSKLILLVLFLVLPFTSIARDLTLSNVPARVFFSPNGGCTKAIVSELGMAKSEVLVQAYSFTSRAIAEALLNAQKRGVSIQIILDKSNLSDRYSAADFTAHAGISTYIDAQHSIAHNKIMIIDNEVVITGSFNFTRAAEVKNAENLLVIRSKELAKIYRDNWREHKEHSEVYKGR
jgi:phosphatidylserine/phosphatidylglycerophosphate/cardiolipin synthase-like enzyme